VEAEHSQTVGRAERQPRASKLTVATALVAVLLCVAVAVLTGVELGRRHSPRCSYLQDATGTYLVCS
jgi:hypothetical protein